MGSQADGRAGLAEVFADGGEMGQLMRETDWARTPLGPVAEWPQSLRTAVSICLSSRFPIVIFWGREYVKLYNDAYRVILGQSKHPRALGAPAREVWPEIWGIIEPMLDSVYRAGASTWSEDQLLLMDRNGYLEEAYFTFSYSPIRDESGGIGGIFTAVAETTERVLSERRLRTLQELSIEAKTVEAAAADALDILRKNRQDAPFALVYLLDEGAGATRSAGAARLAGAVGLARRSRACPETVALDDSAGWPLGEAAATGQGVLVHDLVARFGPLPGSAPSAPPSFAEPPTSAIVLPIPHPRQPNPAGLLVLGISPRRAFDDAYRSFFNSLADHFGVAFTNARAYEEERRRAEALAELDRAKTHFFSNISHEFRTPLTLQLGPLQDLLDGRLGELAEGQREAAALVYRNSLRSLKLVNTLLDFTRVEAGRLEAAFEPVDLAALTADLASTFRSTLERAGLLFCVDCAPLDQPAYVDRNLYEQILLNLLSNAFKFTLEGEICVTLRQEGQPGGQVACLTVSDTGVGIAAEDLGHIFERFYRVREMGARTYEGTGIGLALVQELVKLHGGTIEVVSQPGQGSAFTVTLPLGVAAAPHQHLPAERIVAPQGDRAQGLMARSYVEEAQHWLGVPDANKIDAAPTDEAAGPAAPRVLVADDNADMRGYIARMLGERYEVETAADGQGALAAAQARRPDLVLADVMMPHMDGFGLLHALRDDPALKNVPVILLSARAGEEARAEGLEAGADDYLVKPFSGRELLARVAKHLRAAAAAERREREALDVSNERLQLLHAMDEAILGASSVAEIAGTAARHLRAAMQAYRVSVLRFDFEADEACVLAADADPEFGSGPVDIAVLKHFAPLAPNLRGEVGYVEDLASTPGLHPLQDALLAAGVHSLTSVPLQLDVEGQSRTIGCVLIACRPVGRPDPALVDFARQVAVSLSLAIQSASNVEQLVQREAALAETAALLQASREEFQALSRRLVEALEAERETLARNLHDEAGQTLTVLGMGLARLVRQGKLDAEAAARVAELKQLATNLALELRRIASNLRPLTLDQLGLVPALQQYVEAFGQQTGIAAELAADGLTDEHRDPEAETVLYRIAQEALSNVAQHSRAAHVRVAVAGRPGELELTVADDGQGFDMDEALRRGRLGLLGMRERATMLGGTVEVTSAVGAGATVTARVAVRAPAGGS